ncbi:hypothetical protein EV360DRAFT_70423 [Lentinula raphanica]|nr:hypothetical protein EV360DRAFT_70423 [Lentinula raphanica]
MNIFLFELFLSKRKTQLEFLFLPSPNMRLNPSSVFYALVCLSTILHTACASPVPVKNDVHSDRDTILYRVSFPGKKMGFERLIPLLKNYYRAGLSCYGSHLRQGQSIDISNINQSESEFLPESVQDMEGGWQKLHFAAEFHDSGNHYSGTSNLDVFYHPSGIGTVDGTRTTMSIRLIKADNPGWKLPFEMNIGPKSALQFTDVTPKDVSGSGLKVVDTQDNRPRGLSNEIKLDSGEWKEHHPDSQSPTLSQN